jgi:hypothetical protein
MAPADLSWTLDMAPADLSWTLDMAPTDLSWAPAPYYKHNMSLNYLLNNILFIF